MSSSSYLLKRSSNKEKHLMGDTLCILSRPPSLFPRILATKVTRGLSGSNNPCRGEGRRRRR